MTSPDSQLKRDARRHDVRLAAQQPPTVSRPEIRRAFGHWVLRTSLGAPVAFADDPQQLRAFAAEQYWEQPTDPS